jgi:hypothetical protein
MSSSRAALKLERLSLYFGTNTPNSGYYVRIKVELCASGYRQQSVFALRNLGTLHSPKDQNASNSLAACGVTRYSTNMSGGSNEASVTWTRFSSAVRGGTVEQ